MIRTLNCDHDSHGAGSRGTPAGAGVADGDATDEEAFTCGAPAVDSFAMDSSRREGATRISMRSIRAREWTFNGRANGHPCGWPLREATASIF